MCLLNSNKGKHTQSESSLNVQTGKACTGTCIGVQMCARVKEQQEMAGCVQK